MEFFLLWFIFFPKSHWLSLSSLVNIVDECSIGRASSDVVSGSTDMGSMNQDGIIHHSIFYILFSNMNLDSGF